MGDGNGWVAAEGQSALIDGTDAYLVCYAHAADDGDFSLQISALCWDESGWPVTVTAA